MPALEFKSSYQTIREKLEKEGRIKKLSADSVFQIVDSINAEAASEEAYLYRKI